MIECWACPHCGSAVRCGARLPPLKARIFDAIVRWPQGVAKEALFSALFHDRDVDISTLAVHVEQINRAIRPAGYYIGSRDGNYVIKPKLWRKKRG